MKNLLSLLFLAFTFSVYSQTNGIDKNQIQSQLKSAAPCPALDSFGLIHAWPSDIAFDGQFFWVTAQQQVLRKYDQNGVQDTAFLFQSHIFLSGIYYHNGNLWSVSEGMDSIFQINPNTGNITKRLGFAGQTNGFGIAFVNQEMYVSVYDPNLLLKINPNNGAILSTDSMDSRIFGLTNVNDTLYGTSFRNGLSTGPGLNLFKIDHNNGSFIDSSELCTPYPLGLTHDGSHFWVLSSEVNHGGKEKAFKVIPGLTTGLQAQESYDNAISASPNPAQTQFKLALEKSLYEGSIEIFNINGKKVLTFNQVSGNSIEIDISSLSNGVYFLKAFDQESQASTRIVKI